MLGSSRINKNTRGKNLASLAVDDNLADEPILSVLFFIWILPTFTLYLPKGSFVITGGCHIWYRSKFTFNIA
jgi:hypothetical protein